MFLSMISSKRITARSLPVTCSGSSMMRGSPDGTCTMANSSSPSPPFFFTRAAMFKDLLRISGKGLEESTAMGVSTG